MRIWQIWNQLSSRCHEKVRRCRTFCRALNIRALQFVRQCRTFFLKQIAWRCHANFTYEIFRHLRIKLIELSCPFEQSLSQSLTIHPCFQFLQQARAIFCPVLTMLFKLHDVVTDEPIAHCLHSVDSLDGWCLGSIMRIAYDTCQIVKGMSGLIPVFNRQFHAIMNGCYRFSRHVDSYVITKKTLSLSVRL